MAHSIAMKFQPIRRLGFGSIGAVYMGVGSYLTAPARQFLIQNLTDVTLVFSFDGIEDHVVLPKTGYWVNDITTNNNNTQGLFLAEGTRLYVKQDTIAPTVGGVCFTIMYADGD
jgi:hypothetical protein